MAAEGLDEFIQALGSVGGLSNPVVATTAAFTALAAKLIPFVEAFAPGAVVAFNLAMRDVSAVIGSALLPVLNVMTGLVRQVGDALVPVAAKLAPVLQALADTVGKIIGVWVNTFAGVLASLADAVKPLLPIFEGLGALSQAWGVILGGLINALVAAFLKPFGILNDGADNLKSAFQSLAKAAVLAVGALFKFLGMDSALKGMITALGGDTKKGASSGFAVPTNVQIQDAMSLNRDLAARAFSAQGGGVEDKDDAWRKESLEWLQKLEAGQVTVGDTFRKSLEGLKETLEELKKAAQKIAGGAEKVEQGTRLAGRGRAAAGRVGAAAMTAGGSEIDWHRVRDWLKAKFDVG